MRRTERDARLKLLILQGTLYRGEIIEAKAALCETSKPLAMARRLLGLLTIVLEHRHTALIGAVVPRLLRLGRSSRFARRTLLIIGSALMVWWLIRRRSES